MARKEYWTDKVVVVTGGSAGLGREITIAFGEQGAQVIALGREEAKLKQLGEAAAQFRPPLSFCGISADVTSQTSIDQAIESILSQYQRIDVWVNNVGQSTRIAFQDCRVDDYREFMETNFYSVVRCTLAVLPHLEKSGGHLVNIGSLASRTGWPRIAPYATSKHAVSAFHHQLRLEGPQSVHYLEVCPGPIQRTDGGSRYASQTESLGQSAAQPGSGVKLKGISPSWLARRIVKACRNRQAELLIPFYTRILFALGQLFPVLSDKILLFWRRRD